MATMAEQKPILINGGNGGRIGPARPAAELEKAQDVARRYRCEFVDLHDFQLQHDLFKKIPVDLMFRYNFVPLEETPDGRLAIAIADPSQLMMIDEISLLLSNGSSPKSRRSARSPKSSRRQNNRNGCSSKRARVLRWIW